jgi:hypothetical protein
LQVENNEDVDTEEEKIQMSYHAEEMHVGNANGTGPNETNDIQCNIKCSHGVNPKLEASSKIGRLTDKGDYVCQLGVDAVGKS